MQQEIFIKMLGKYGKSRILIANQHFSMVLLWRHFHRDFLRFVNWSHPSGWRGNFYKVAQRAPRPAPVIMRSFDCWEPQLSKKYRIDRGFHNISDSTIFKLFKSRWAPGCTAACGGLEQPRFNQIRGIGNFLFSGFSRWLHFTKYWYRMRYQYFVKWRHRYEPDFF